MIRLCKIHMRFLFQHYAVMVSYGVILLWFVICLSISGYHNGIQEITFRQEYYKEAFLFDGITFLKLIILIHVLFDVIYVVILNKYDTILSNLYRNEKVVLSKLFTLLFYNLLVTMIMVSIYICLWIVLPYDVSIYDILSMYTLMGMYTVHCSMVFVLFYYYFEHMLTIMIPFIVAIISIFSIDYDSSLESLTLFAWVIQLLYPDVVYLNGEIVYTTGIVYVLTLLLLISGLMVHKYKESDHLYC